MARVRVPDEELAVLGGAHEVLAVGGPVQRVDLGEMPAEHAPRAHVPHDGHRRDAPRRRHAAQRRVLSAPALARQLLLQRLALRPQPLVLPHERFFFSSPYERERGCF